MPVIISVILSFIFNSNSVSAVTDNLSIQSGCSLESSNREKKFFPGHMCIFHDDGTLVSSSGNGIRKFSKTREILWEQHGSFHHQMNISSDKKRILTFVNELTLVDKQMRRQDVVLILDQDGKTLARISAAEILKLSGLEPMNGKNSDHQADNEISHFNSIYEIPPNKREKEIPWLKSGNIIINGLFHGIFVFSPDLKILLHHLKLDKGPHGHSLHDVQVTPDGNLLYFNNHAGVGTKKRFSAIQKIDPVKKKIIFEFTARPKEMFFSAGAGGVQEIGDYIFFSHSLTGGYLYSRKNRDIVGTYPQNLGTSVRWIQDIKMIDATEFLKNSN